MSIFISLCLIVKNEEKVLDRCLASIAHLVDEVIIADTGSMDRTKEIAAKYTSNIYDFTWVNDFSAARNFVASKATGEWILVLDADEYVDESNFKEFETQLRENKEDQDSFSIKIINFTGQFGEKVVQNLHERVYKNDGDICYYRQVHEQLTRKSGIVMDRTGSSKLIAFHSGYMNKTVKEKEKKDRNQSLIEQEMEKGDNAAFDYFNLGNERLSYGDVEGGLQAFVKAYELKRDFRLSWATVAIIQIINCLVHLKKYADALNVIADAEQMYTAASEIPVLRGQVYLALGQIDDAKEQFMKILNNKDHYTHIILNSDAQEQVPHRMLGGIYFDEGDDEKAIHHYMSVLNINKYCAVSLKRAMMILNKAHTNNEISQFINKHIDLSSQDYLVRFCLVLLTNNNAEIVRSYVEKVDDDVIKRGLQFRLSLLEHNHSLISKMVDEISLADLVVWANSGLIDMMDFIIIILYTNNTRFFNLIQQFLQTVDSEFMHKVIFEKGNGISNIEYYKTLLERVLTYDLEEVLVSILDLKSNFSREIEAEIGDILFYYHKIDRALYIYDSLPELSLYTVQAFSNICQLYMDAENYESALKYANLALEVEKYDFRTIKCMLNIFKYVNSTDDILNVIGFGLSKYKDSHYLQHEISQIFNELLLKSELDLAQKAVDILRSVEGESAKLINMNAILHIVRGELSESQYILEQGVDTYPDNYDMVFNLNYVYELQGFHEKSKVLLKWMTAYMGPVRGINPDVPFTAFISSLNENEIRYVILNDEELITDQTKPLSEIKLLVHEDDEYKMSRFLMPIKSNDMIIVKVSTPTLLHEEYLMNNIKMTEALAYELLESRVSHEDVFILNKKLVIGFDT